MDHLKIVLVGGGSVNWTPRIGSDLLLTPALTGAEIVLYDIHKAASDLTQAFLQKAARQIGAEVAIVSTDNRQEALSGADYVLITISTGGLDAMAHDLAIPEAFGIYHTVGDTSGPGGWARLIRNFDVFVALAEDINRYAPGALVLNYTNPMTTLTDVLARICQGPVIGLCHGLFENLEFIQRRYDLPGEDDIAVQYAGLNHFFWITQARAGESDVVADLGQRLAKQSFTEIMAGLYEGGRTREFATELFRTTGVFPYLGDRHTCEFFPGIITNPANLAKYKLVRTSIAERKDGMAAARRRVTEMVGGEIAPAYLKRTRETAADIIAAHSQGRVFIDVGNVPNIGQVANLPRGLVVETAVRVDRNGFSPLTFGDLPPIVKGFIEPYAALFPMVVDACFRRDKRLALQALRLDPVCAHLNGEQVVDLGERLLAAHGQF
jgi:alpha-galactosidase